jgi:hypothetical protein
VIRFSLSKIQNNAPYEIELTGSSFRFVTENNIHYSISFSKEDIVLGGTETYQFIIQKVDTERSGHDSKVQQTILSIIYEFFRLNENVLLYICDTSDGREAARNRLFISWFEKDATPGRFTIKTAKANIEGEVLYTAIIVENSHPNIKKILQDFNEQKEALEK